MARITLADRSIADRTGKGIRIAVVDSGIAPNHPHVGAISAGVSLVGDPADTTDRIGHGTAVAAVIREKAPDAELVPVRVFDRELKTDAQTLVRAITWASEHDCRIVNLSLGTSNAEHEDLLREAILNAGVMIVGACESDGVRWLPGSLRSAVGVLPDAEIARDTIETEEVDGGTRVRASIYPRPIPGVPRERNFHGVSFAVANVTGFMARWIEGSKPDEAVARNLPPGHG